MTAADNPFTSRSAGPVHEAEEPPRRSLVLETISAWQFRLNTHMAALVRETRDTGRLGPLASLLAIAFAYGVLHAAGPGHGKAFALSYVVTRKPTRLQGLMFSHLITLFHGASGIVFVLFIRMILKAGVTRHLDQATRISQMASYTLIALIGLAMAGSGIIQLLKRTGKTDGDAVSRISNPVLFALMVGCVPCPGVVTVMLFAMSMDLMGLGILLGAAISLGMAVTVSLIVMLAISGRNTITDLADKKDGWAHYAEHGMKTLGGFALAVLGTLFFLSLT
ncbi:nickel/cobalt transporter [Desulfatiferula olefinivorans]